MHKDVLPTAQSPTRVIFNWCSVVSSSSSELDIVMLAVRGVLKGLTYLNAESNKISGVRNLSFKDNILRCFYITIKEKAPWEHFLEV